MAREITSGAELADYIAERWTSPAFGAGTTPTTNPARNIAGDGGSRSFRFVTAGSSTSESFVFLSGRIPRSYRARFRVFRDASGASGYQLRFVNGASTVISVRVASVSGIMTINNQAGAVLATAVGSIPPGQYFQVEIEVYHALAGFCRVYVDDPGTYAAPFLTFSGDTRGTGGILTSIDRIGMSMNGGTIDFDDIAFNTLTMLYDTGVGAIPVAGQTVQLAVGRTFVITSVEGTTIAGRLIMENYSATLFPMADNAPITIIASGWTGQVNAPNSSYVNGMEPQSMFPGNGYILDRGVTGNGATIQLTPVGAAANFQCIDERPPNSTDHCDGGTDGFYDMYAYAALPASVLSVTCITTWSNCQKDNIALNNCQLPLRAEGIDYTDVGVVLGASTDGQIPLSTDYASIFKQWCEHPDGVTGPITPTVAGSSQSGFRVRT